MMMVMMIIELKNLQDWENMKQTRTDLGRLYYKAAIW